MDVFDLDQDDIAVVDPLDHFVDVLLEVMRSRFLQMLVDEDVDGVLRGSAEALTDAAVMRQGIVAANLRVLGQFAGNARAIQGAAPKFEDESLHGASLYARCAPEAETALEKPFAIPSFGRSPPAIPADHGYVVPGIVPGRYYEGSVDDFAVVLVAGCRKRPFLAQ